MRKQKCNLTTYEMVSEVSCHDEVIRRLGEGEGTQTHNLPLAPWCNRAEMLKMKLLQMSVEGVLTTLWLFSRQR